VIVHFELKFWITADFYAELRDADGSCYSTCACIDELARSIHLQQSIVWNLGNPGETNTSIVAAGQATWQKLVCDCRVGSVCALATWRDDKMQAT